MRLPRVLRFTPADHEERGCRCGHESRAHEHYRRGTDCALCTCPRFKMGAAAARQEQPRDALGERVHAA